jgi:ketosteroid isomerase-like protein
MRALVDCYLAAYNKFDIDGMLECLHPAVQFSNIAGGEVNASTTGIAEFRALAEQSTALFSERKQTVLAFDCGHDQAAASIAFRAIVANDLPNGLTRGQALELAGRSEFVFRDDAIVEIRDIS